MKTKIALPYSEFVKKYAKEIDYAVKNESHRKAGDYEYRGGNLVTNEGKTLIVLDLGFETFDEDLKKVEFWEYDIAALEKAIIKAYPNEIPKDKLKECEAHLDVDTLQTHFNGDFDMFHDLFDEICGYAVKHLAVTPLQTREVWITKNKGKMYRSGYETFYATGRTKRNIHKQEMWEYTTKKPE